MSEQDQEFQQRWEPRRNESDLDSSSNDHSGPSSASKPKLKKHKPVTNGFYEENNQETTSSQHPGSRAETHLRYKETNKEPNPSLKKLRCKGKVKNKRIDIDYEPFDVAMSDLRCYSKSLIEGVKVSRESLLKWMSNETEKSIQNDAISSKPNGKGRTRRSNSARAIPVRVKRKSSITAQKLDVGSSETVKSKTTSNPTTELGVETVKEVENTPAVKTPLSSTQKQKRKRSGLSENKQRSITDRQKAGSTNKQNGKTYLTDRHNYKPAVVAPVPNYLTWPTVLPRLPIELEGSEKNHMAEVKERAFKGKTTMNATTNLGLQLLACSSKPHQKDALFPQNGLGDVIDYKENKGPKQGNIGRGYRNENGFPFPFAQGIDIPNTNQFGFLSRENGMPGLGMNERSSRLASESHVLMQNYGALDQHLPLKGQGAVMQFFNLQPKPM